MKKIRIGKTFDIRWKILTNKENVPLVGRNLTLELVNHKHGNKLLDYSIEDGNVIVARIEGREQYHTGVYALALWENYGDVSQMVVDKQSAFSLVPTTEEEGGCMSDRLDVSVGVGISTSSIAVGIKGDKGDKGDPFTFADFTPEQLDDIKRPATEAVRTATAAAQRADNAAETAETETEALRAERQHIAYVNRDNGWAATQTFGDIVVGNIIQQGESYEIHAQQVYTTQDMVVLRDGAVGALPSGEFAGLVARKYNGADDGYLIYDNEGARVGKEGDTEPLMTRAEKTDMVDGAPLVWDAEGKRAVSGQWPAQPQWVYKEMEVTYEDDGSTEVFFVPTLLSDPNAAE